MKTMNTNLIDLETWLIFQKISSDCANCLCKFIVLRAMCTFSSLFFCWWHDGDVSSVCTLFFVSTQLQHFECVLIYLVFCVKVEIVDSIQMCSAQFLTTTHQKFHIISQQCQKHSRKTFMIEKVALQESCCFDSAGISVKKTYFCSAIYPCTWKSGKVRVLLLNCGGLWNFRNILCC